jgi:hypothetical protein
MPEDTKQREVEAARRGHKGTARRIKGRRRRAAAASDVTAEQQDTGMLARAAKAGRAARKSKIPTAKPGATRPGYKVAKKPASLGGGYYWKKTG